MTDLPDLPDNDEPMSYVRWNYDDIAEYLGAMNQMYLDEGDDWAHPEEWYRQQIAELVHKIERKQMVERQLDED